MTRPFRRLVLYLPGFDPFPPRRYRELFRRESEDQARISGYALRMAGQPAAGRFGWAASADFPDGPAETRFEVLPWADLVQASMVAGIPGTYRQLLQTAWAYIASGALFRLIRLRRGPVLAALYPIVVLILQLLAGLLLGWLAGWLLAPLSGLAWLGWLVAVAICGATLWAFRSQDHRIFAYYLMHDYAFTAKLNGAYPPELEQKITEFVTRIRTALREDVDEVLIVGHSSGAYIAVSALADLLRDEPLPAGAPVLSLLTLGHVVPMAAFLPKAQRLRADLAWLSECADLFWLDVTAPGDACSFALCDPVAVTGVAGPDQRWPLVISAAYRQTLSAERQRALRGHWFKLHFQYLCAFDRPGDYDYFAITCGPKTLSQRFGHRSHSPGRITTPAGPGLP
ncbi:hypothetical protein [Paracoccus fistulariae]|uniref:Alpha/beta hydrolase n=1 Tax=Paracoccus fistulariae TaxID=658446 RepID=A0ABY7SKU9_9RHOB|nr:hypothetical protein [Paracoccus fistulariae]MDB6181612.1 hypothetical protein [Paracoccus fistulariae]WCR07636.1 hypothetical protein JHX87_01955 [Paracoccus fistulariae]